MRTRFFFNVCLLVCSFPFFFVFIFASLTFFILLSCVPMSFLVSPFALSLFVLQLATNEWIPSTSVLEGVVILKRNPELDEPAATPAPSAGAAGAGVDGGAVGSGTEESKGSKD